MRRPYAITLSAFPMLESASFIGAAVVFPSRPVIAILLICLASVSLSFALHISYHEAAHRSGAWPAWHRTILGIALTPLMGLSFHGYRIGHWNHHRYNNHVEDFTSTWKRGDGKPVPRNLAWYCLAWPRAFLTGRELAKMALLDGDAKAGDLIRSVAENLVSLAAIVTLVAWMPHVGLLYLLMIYLGWALVSLHNYGQHPPQDYDGGVLATSYASPWYNRLFYNNGLHYEHHKQPGRPIEGLTPDGAARQVGTTHLLAPLWRGFEGIATRR